MTSTTRVCKECRCITCAPDRYGSARLGTGAREAWQPSHLMMLHVTKGDLCAGIVPVESSGERRDSYAVAMC